MKKKNSEMANKDEKSSMNNKGLKPEIPNYMY